MEDQQIEMPVDGLVVYEKKALERVNPFRQKLNELRETYKEFPDLNSTAGIKEAKSQIAAFRGLKGDVEEERKGVKTIINKLAKAVDDSYNAVWDEAEKEQKERDAKLKEFEAEKERIAKEKKDAEERLKFQRFAAISKMGAMEVEDRVVLGDYRIETRLIGSSTEEVWQNHILKGFTEQHEKIEAERQEQLRLEQERQEKLRREQEELKRQREEFEKQQAELQRQREEFEAKQREAERLELKRKQEEEQRKRWEEAEKKRQLEKARQDKINARLEQLTGNIKETPVGWEYNGHIVLTDDELAGFADEDFNRVRDFHNKQVADNLEAERITKEEEEKQKAIEAKKLAIGQSRKAMMATIGVTDTSDHDFSEMPQGEWDEVWEMMRTNYETAKHNEWLAKEQERKDKEEAERQAKIEEANDREKWKDVVEYLKKTPLHPMRSSQYRTKMKIVKDFLADLN